MCTWIIYTTTESYAGLHMRKKKLLHDVSRKHVQGDMPEEIIQQEVKIKKNRMK